MEGSISDLKNDVGELERIENLYIKALSKETNMSKKYIKKLFEQKVDIYLTAEEAVELGIVDEVI
jgi:ATP-dependent Clp protease protease subunit